METRKLPTTGKPLTPKAPIQSKSGPYLAPRLATTQKVTPSPEIRRDNRDGASQVQSGANNRANVATPVKAFLATNVTPRSSSRKSRADSTNSTPNSTPGGTPLNSRPGSIALPVDELQGLGIRNGAEQKNTKVESAVNNNISPPVARQYHGLEARDGASPSIESPMFFHARDAVSIPKKQPPPIQRTGTGFVYANGREEAPVSKPMSSVGTRPASQVGSYQRFYHANGIPETLPVLSASPANTSPVISPKLSMPAGSSTTALPRQRSNSPLKEFEIPGQQIINKGRRTSGTSMMSSRSMAKPTTQPQTRPILMTSPSEPRMHTKNPSISSIIATPQIQSPGIQSEPSLFVLNSPQSVRDQTASPGFFGIQTIHQGSGTTPSSPLTSPDRTVSTTSESKIDQLNSLANNARRERKVLDLEISNSSLLAINRTLEREMRKQKAELRRYRRLTSGGRISFVPAERSVSGTTTISTLSLDSDRAFESDGEDTLTDIASEDEDEDLESSDDSDLSLSPQSQAAKDLRQRARDEKRLQLDLSRHQQLLIDSQTMNESLKRCLGWTEELILEGKKALASQVRASEVPMGGRVLHEDENPEFEDAQPRHGLLSPTVLYAKHQKELGWTTDASPAGTIVHRPEMNHVAAMAHEGKEFREYLDALDESGVSSGLNAR